MNPTSQNLHPKRPLVIIALLSLIVFGIYTSWISMPVKRTAKDGLSDDARAQLLRSISSGQSEVISDKQKELLMKSLSEGESKRQILTEEQQQKLIQSITAK